MHDDAAETVADIVFADRGQSCSRSRVEAGPHAD